MHRDKSTYYGQTIDTQLTGVLNKAGEIPIATEATVQTVWGKKRTREFHIQNWSINMEDIFVNTLAASLQGCGISNLQSKTSATSSDPGGEGKGEGWSLSFLSTWKDHLRTCILKLRLRPATQGLKL